MFFTIVFQGTRLPPDQRQLTTALPPHLADVLIINDAGSDFIDQSGRSKPLKLLDSMLVLYFFFLLPMALWR